jgi:hypothetical protein
MFVLRRLQTEHALRGIPGVANLVMSRLARSRSDLLFERELSASDALPEVDSLPVIVVNRNNVGTDQTRSVEEQILQGDNEQYRDSLSERDWMFAGLDADGRVITYAFVLFRTQYKQILGISEDLPLISNCFTVAEHRGKRLYPRMLARVCRELALAGHSRAAISCAPDNTASISGIERAGFSGVAHLECLNVLSRLVFNRRTTDYATWRAANLTTANRQGTVG